MDQQNSSLSNNIPNLRQLPRDFIGTDSLGECTIPLPEKVQIGSSLEEILCFARSKNASDVHISVNKAMFFNI